MNYAMQAPHVEQSAASWLSPQAAIILPTLEQIKTACDPLVKEHPFPAYEHEIKKHLDELRELASLRDDPTQVQSNDKQRPRRKISSLLNWHPAPVGAVYNTRRAQVGDIITTGRELARYFENDTPGLPYTHALNHLFSTRSDFTPPRQAQVWAALHTAIYAALLASWHYKWDDPATKLKPRPSEIDPKLSVLFAYASRPDGSGDCGPVRHKDGKYHGVPRHPAYPSGHSAVGGAASEVLTLYFPELKEELDDLADNSGLARMWAGIHWRPDHTFGVALGRKVAQLVTSQLKSTMVSATPPAAAL